MGVLGMVLHREMLSDTCLKLLDGWMVLELRVRKEDE